MGYTTVPTAVTGDTWTAGNMNTYVRDNFRAGVPHIFEYAGDLAVASAANTAVRSGISSPGSFLQVGSDGISIAWDSGNFIGCSIQRTSGQIINEDTWTKIQFQSEDYDTDNLWSSTNNDEVLIPQDGVYQVSGVITFDIFRGIAGCMGSIAIGPDDTIISNRLVSNVNYGDVPHPPYIISAYHSFCYVDRFASGSDVYLKVRRYLGGSTINYNITGIYNIAYLGAST